MLAPEKRDIRKSYLIASCITNILSPVNAEIISSLHDSQCSCKLLEGNPQAQKRKKKKLTCLEVFGRSVKHTEPYGLWAQKLLVCMVYSPPGAFVVVLVVLVVLGQIPSTS